MPQAMVVESDVAFAEEIRSALQGRWPGETDVQVITDGQGALKAASATPPGYHPAAGRASQGQWVFDLQQAQEEPPAQSPFR